MAVSLFNKYFHLVNVLDFGKPKYSAATNYGCLFRLAAVLSKNHKSYYSRLA